MTEHFHIMFFPGKGEPISHAEMREIGRTLAGQGKRSATRVIAGPLGTSVITESSAPSSSSKPSNSSLFKKKPPSPGTIS